MAHFDGLRPARLTVGVVSAGRVGTALGVALERAEHVVVATAAVSDASRRRAAERLPDTPVLPVAEVAARSELLLLAVPDTELAALAAGLAVTGAVRPGAIVAHTAGAHGIGVLAPLTALGCIPLALHPAMTFTGGHDDIARLSGTCFAVTAADDIGHAVGQSLVWEIGGEPFAVAEAARPLYHAALAHAANHLTTVVGDALDALRAALSGTQQPDGIPGGVAERIVAPLARAALDNTLEHGGAALTGPVARGDAAAVGVHLRALAAVDDDLAAAYRAASHRTAQRAHAPRAVFDVLAGDPASPTAEGGLP